MNIGSPTEPHFPCPCCGYIVFDKPPESYEICPICCWQDDQLSLRWMTVPGEGQNDELSLDEAQRNYCAFGAASLEVRQYVRQPRPTDGRDPEWRMIDLALDNPEAAIAVPTTEWPRDKTTLYYWRDTYWLKGRR